MENYNKLDIAARLFPAVTSKNNSSVFRVSIVLKEEIDPKVLQLAVNMLYQRYDLFFIRLRKGFFWNYFDKNHIYFTVEKEHAAPCSTIIAHENKGFVIKVLYYGNRISVEAFHSITDGGGVVEYIKSLTYYYLTIKHGNFDDEGKILLFNEFENTEDEDSFVKNFSNLPKLKKATGKKDENSFRIKGIKFSRGGHGAITGIMSVIAIKHWCKAHGCTITAFLIAKLIIAIYEKKQKGTKNKKPIVVSVPVNLRNIFKSETLKNFFVVVNVGYTMTEQTTFEELTKSISTQMSEALDERNLQSESNKNVKITHNVVLKYAPLIVKNMIVPVGFNLMGETKKTITISNLGKVDFPTDIKPFIEHSEVMIYPTPKSPINCAVSSFEDKLAVTFTTAVTDISVIRRFFKSLNDVANIDISVYSNSWGEKNEQM